MKHYLLLILPVGALILSSCDSGTTPEPVYDYLVSEEYNRAINQQSLLFFWSAAGVPEAADFIRHDLDAYRIVYQTEGLQGEPVHASGAILVPRGVSSPNLLSIQHATIFSDSEAPSVDQGISVTDRKAIFASLGNIVFLPDYLGYGVSGDLPHPYQHEATLARAGYDMILAGLEFLESKGIEWSGNSIGLAGYSEGAYASLALARKMETSSSALQINFISMGSPILDLTSTMDQILNNIDDEYECVACYAYFLKSYHTIYNFPGNLGDYFQSPYDQRISDGLFDGSNSADEVISSLPQELSLLFTESFITRYFDGEEPHFTDAVAENDLFYIPVADLLLVHGDADGVAPVFNSDDFIARAEQAGKMNLEYLRAEGVNHSEGVFSWGLATLSRLAQMNGKGIP